MHIHILGICGTFMGGIAALASALGHKVTGSDSGIYPPMSTQLAQMDITLHELDDLKQFNDNPDIVVIGNALSRGMPAVEFVLDNNIPYTSGPEWLKQHILKDRWVLAVAGTHGKTTTTSILTWILEHAGLNPGFLIGGVAQNFNLSARLGSAPFFVIEADEYDSAFFDKRAKCVHYLPRTFVINNLEFDHADIYADLSAIQTQIHHAVRTIPSHGCVFSHASHDAVQEAINKGCWSEQQQIGREWRIEPTSTDYATFILHHQSGQSAQVTSSLFGLHNMHNTAMAIIAAHHVGVTLDIAVEAVQDYVNVKRRMELKGSIRNVNVYDDFAHHPTAIETSLDGLRKHQPTGRILAVIEPRSNTMKTGVHKETLHHSWRIADRVWVKTSPDMTWLQAAVEQSGEQSVYLVQNTSDIVKAVVKEAQSGDHIVVMSNGGFDGIHEKLLEAL
ncbi:UDP-N-acetylmuramate:L-alanyl-gamma-D-glutamyl-meso-diaminopimelate ligase [Alteromonas sediminis]|uniref:UDP-N-acetylmuramate--L-alanyl-gamma-D-glutamyl-meso-2,6-diaminoheptandioate ligase n=1 Tax=Alteromonas sediminis TaxID=2259342 RepID=A0A3N5Y562_9ALTE|nr:UDP-N-acetylmuramate:L-alanyl-gamma-D-glutamyl-meso-diaminopimelate ligase [Alteromonas sediminis]RPJ65349.1 UDP-N-acetylmuramate:L-alanyl-gamma-D-glutamyl-meso-diaminopimelate ligase [Alteromonas sediminis]